MKVVNKIMIGIAVLCLLLCGGILVFALNPDMTSSLAQKLYGNTVDMPPGIEETEEGQTSGNGNISVTLPNGMPGEMNGYVAPSMDQMQIPEDVSGRTGFTPVQPEEQQIPDQEAQNLEKRERGCHFPQRSIRIIRCCRRISSPYTGRFMPTHRT